MWRKGDASGVSDEKKERESKRVSVEHKSYFTVPLSFHGDYGMAGLVTMAAMAAETEPPPGAGVRAPTLWTNCRRERDANCPSI